MHHGCVVFLPLEMLFQAINENNQDKDQSDAYSASFEDLPKSNVSSQSVPAVKTVSSE